ncbi:MAG: hypothetical protein ACOCWQ_05790 [Nanoarchaeota archaeon]
MGQYFDDTIIKDNEYFVKNDDGKYVKLAQKSPDGKRITIYDPETGDPVYKVDRSKQEYTVVLDPSNNVVGVRPDKGTLMQNKDNKMLTLLKYDGGHLTFDGKPIDNIESGKITFADGKGTATFKDDEENYRITEVEEGREKIQYRYLVGDELSKDKIEENKEKDTSVFTYVGADGSRINLEGDVRENVQYDTRTVATGVQSMRSLDVADTIQMKGGIETASGGVGVLREENSDYTSLRSEMTEIDKDIKDTLNAFTTYKDLSEPDKTIIENLEKEYEELLDRKEALSLELDSTPQLTENKEPGGTKSAQDLKLTGHTRDADYGMFWTDRSIPITGQVVDGSFMAYRSEEGGLFSKDTTTRIVTTDLERGQSITTHISDFTATQDLPSLKTQIENLQNSQTITPEDWTKTFGKDAQVTYQGVGPFNGKPAQVTGTANMDDGKQVTASAVYTSTEKGRPKLSGFRYKVGDQPVIKGVFKQSFGKDKGDFVEVDGKTYKVRRDHNGFVDSVKTADGEKVDEATADKLESAIEGMRIAQNNAYWENREKQLAVKRGGGPVLHKFFDKIDIASKWAGSFHGYSSLFMEEESLKEWRESVDRVFASLNLGAEYWSSTICANKLDMPAGQQVAYSFGPNPYDQTSTGGGVMVSATCAGQRQKVVTPFGEEIYLYQVTFMSRNPSDNEMQMNVELRGPDGNVYVFREDQPVQAGEVLSRFGKNAFAQQSPNLYTECCVHMVNGPPMAVGSNPVCNRIAEPDTTPTVIKGPESQGGAQQGAPAAQQQPEYNII